MVQHGVVIAELETLSLSLSLACSLSLSLVFVVVNLKEVGKTLDLFSRSLSFSCVPGRYLKCLLL